jgi:cytochrome oxidase Cu insertion factor (SCO1/SenC/PrrC family)
MRRQRSVLVGLALLFFAPLGLAFFLYYGLGWHPGGRVNHGQLVDPPEPLPALALPLAATGAGADATASPRLLKDKWTYLYLGPGACPAACQQALYTTRQVRTALGKDRERVQRVFIAGGECCDTNLLRTMHPDLITVRDVPEAAPLVELLRKSQPLAESALDRIYVVDPLGNLMMSYAADATPKGMLEDLKRLLGLSHVG